MKIRVGAVTGAVLLLVGCSTGSDAGGVSPTPTPSATTDTVVGSLAVEADIAGNIAADFLTKDGQCIVKAGYDDQATGAKVVISDASGSTVAIGSLSETGLQIIDGSTSAFDTWCGFKFSVKDVPTGGKFYGVAIGHRDPIQFSEDEVFGGELSLTLGDIPGH